MLLMLSLPKHVWIACRGSDGFSVSFVDVIIISQLQYPE